MTKYRLTGITNELGLYRIEAVVDGPWGPAGTKGGWVASESNLSQDGSCWIGGNAWVYGNACVSGNAVVTGSAYVGDKARVGGNAHIGGKAHVWGEARIYGDAQVSGSARIYGLAHVYDKAQVLGSAWVGAEACVFGSAYVGGTARIAGGASIAGSAHIYASTDYLCMGPLGPYEMPLTVYRTSRGLEASTGNITASLDAILPLIEAQFAGYPGSAEFYRRAVVYARAHFQGLSL